MQRTSFKYSQLLVVKVTESVISTLTVREKMILETNTFLVSSRMKIHVDLNDVFWICIKYNLWRLWFLVPYLSSISEYMKYDSIFIEVITLNECTYTKNWKCDKGKLLWPPFHVYKFCMFACVWVSVIRN